MKKIRAEVATKWKDEKEEQRKRKRRKRTRSTRACACACVLKENIFETRNARSSGRLRGLLSN